MILKASLITNQEILSDMYDVIIIGGEVGMDTTVREHDQGVFFLWIDAFWDKDIGVKL